MKPGSVSAEHSGFSLTVVIILYHVVYIVTHCLWRKLHQLGHFAFFFFPEKKSKIRLLCLFFLNQISAGTAGKSKFLGIFAESWIFVTDAESLRKPQNLLEASKSRCGVKRRHSGECGRLKVDLFGTPQDAALSPVDSARSPKRPQTRQVHQSSKHEP